MKILILSGSPIIGGGELVARRLAVGLARAGCNIIYVSVRPEKITEPGVYHYVIDAGPVQGWIFRHLRFLSYSLAYELNTSFAMKNIGRILQKEKPDIINIHIIKQAFWSPEIVGFCAERAPVVWTLHDMSSFTGRCVHSFSCKKYMKGCDETCPSPHIPVIIPRTLTRKRWLHHKIILTRHPSIVAVCPSNWLADRTRESIWADHRIEVIPNGIDFQEFFPIAREKAREQLGFPHGITLILIAAADLSSPIKGGALFWESLKRIHIENLGIVIMGRGSRISDRDLKFPLFNLGFVSPDQTPVVYSSVDLLVNPSRAESFGMVATEANACGIPVLAFANTALNEIIKDGVNGWLVKENTVDALVEKMNVVLKQITDEKLSLTSREYAYANYSIEKQVKAYITLFSGLLQDQEEYH